MIYKLKAPIRGTNAVQKYQCYIEWRNGKLLTDEPPELGGQDTGPDPHTLLLSSLVACTLVTLRMYIDRKGWDIPFIAVNANLYEEKKEMDIITIIDRDIVFLSPVDDEKKLRLQEIASRCPISKILQHEIKVRTFVLRDGEAAKMVKYANDDITVIWKPELCQHSARCFTQLPEVFDPKLKKWINPDGAPADAITQQVKKCPSGALSFYLPDNPPGLRESNSAMEDFGSS